MADLLIKRKEIKPNLEGKIEIELVDGKIETIDVSITNSALVKAKKMFDDPNTGSKELFEFIRYDFIGLPSHLMITDNEAMDTFTRLSEHMGNREQRRNNRFQG